MPDRDVLHATIEAVHTAGLDSELWPNALGLMTRLLGGAGATLETIDLPPGRRHDIRALNVPRLAEIDYLRHYAAASPRIALGLRQRVNDIGWDRQILDERAMDRDPFYAEFLRRIGFRYFVSGVLHRDRKQLVVAAVQRSPRQGHVGRREINLMRLLLPHLRRALDVNERLKGADRSANAFEHVLDWLADGAALVGADGAVLHANDSLWTIAQRDDGIRLSKERLEFSAAEAGSRYASALAAVANVLDAAAGTIGSADFPVARAAGGPPYLVSVRPLPHSGDQIQSAAMAVVFVHDPLRRYRSSIEVLREVFGFTAAEAHLARALQAGVPIAEYAREAALSLNTVYTHMRRIKEKTRTKRQAELIRILNDLQLPLRD